MRKRIDFVPTHHPRTGFTLIELLVVIGIAGALMAALLPALAAARRQAAATVCRSRLQEYVRASLLYVGDTNGYFPYAHLILKQSDPQKPKKSIASVAGTLRRYAPDPRMILCPVEPEALDIRDAYGQLLPPAPDLPQYTSYQLNLYVYKNALTPRHVAPRRIESLQSDSDLILAYDGTVSVERGGPWEVMQARHPGPRFNAAFLDGHVEGIGATRKGTTHTLPEGKTVPAYLVDRGNRPIYYAGAEDVQFYDGGELWDRDSNQGLESPGYGAIVYGPVVERGVR